MKVEASWQWLGQRARDTTRVVSYVVHGSRMGHIYKSNLHVYWLPFKVCKSDYLIRWEDGAGGP